MQLYHPADQNTQTWSDIATWFSLPDGTTFELRFGLTILVVLAALFASILLSRFIAHAYRRALRAIMPETLHSPKPPTAIIALVQLAIGLAAVALCLSLWGIEPETWNRGSLFAGALRIIVILLLATALWDIGGASLSNLLRETARRAAAPRRAAQLHSLEPMTLGALRAVVAVFAALLIISQLGFEVGPLLAGAGVVGIAIGFGAQTLVKDYLTGFSLVLEDIVSVGDIVRIGESGGLVEMMTLRTIRLRDFDGSLHVFPYSEAQVIHNLTKTFSYYVFNLQISYESNIDDALRLMRGVGDAMSREAAYKDAILDPIEVVGVDQLADSGVVLKARIKTAPLQQWNVGREYNRRIKIAFDEAGIEIPVPHLKLLLPEQTLAALRPA